jgi:AraC-like DNA-binding protein
LDHRYRELTPPAHLASYLRCLWTETTSDRPEHPGVLVLPDGCIDIVWIAGAPPAVAGPATRPVFPSIPLGSTLVGMRFHPGMASSALGVPANELENLDLPLSELWGNELARPPGRFDESGLPRDGFEAMQALLTRRLATVGPGDELVKAAAGWVVRHPGSGLGRLAELTGLSDRQLRRRFESAVGYGPKTFQRIVRFQRWLKLTRSTPVEQRKLTDLAAAAGYADQSHLTREVVRLAGRAPAALLASTAPVTV